VRFHIVETSLGWVGLGFSERGLFATTLPLAERKTVEEQLRHRGATAPALPDEIGDWPERIRAYIDSGELISPDGLDLEQGTPFQRAVWQTLLEIPCGETRSYRWVAERIGRPRAARAVGQAMGANPLPLLLPCHRVVSSGGGLGGFGGGLALKTTLLRAEAHRRPAR